ncbi:MAG: MFS transporter, DHA3 family, macrolide efflux protein [Phormidesmis priestleyi Ana]|uniref:MFS transporter, DHA3 family, macrolide efflux protein n=1 Tax=Phormidesmis priestleyi Ana TaxID=1666911 RepID=A0A0P8C4J5_9CYAN|nr:MAG: MFS transporter, DHA3 family, macrolide efflux protein [Phormidesmis priestleyi Ana]
MGVFVRIWAGQLVSTIGSYMTVFALMIWIWQETGSATTLALVTFFSQLPRIAITPIAGIIVDRFPRKQLILLGDVVAAVGTLMIGLLFWQGLLQLWHLYIIVTLYGCFGQLQTLAYSTSIALLVSKENYTRAESMVAAVGYSGAIFSPILAGSLYPIIGLTGIITVDLSTFGVAFLLLVLATIPHPKRSEESASLGLRDLTFGFRYIWSKPGLMAMVIAFSLFAIPSDLGKALYNPMILARSGGDAQILGLVTTAAGIGGVLGALAVSVSGGFKRRIDGMLIGFIATGLFKIALALGQAPWMWMFSHFAATLAIPLFYSSSNAIWYAKVPPELQGRVLAADQMIGLGVGAIAPLIAGPLADQVFEPMMQSKNWVSAAFSPLFGTGVGSGMAFLYAIAAAAMTLVGIGGYGFKQLRDVEELLPDHSLIVEDTVR